MNNNLLVETSIKNLNSVKSYNKYISQFPKGNPNKIRIGEMWAFDYDFYKHYDPEDLKYFDKRPNSIFVSRWPAKGLYLGINVHFLPLLLRAQFINKLRLRNPLAFKKDGITPIKVSYQIIKQVFFKSKYAVRWYRPEAISNAYRIPNKEWVNVSQYQINSFYKVDINQIVDRYKNWQGEPKSKNKQNLKESLNFDFESFLSNNPNIINTLQDNQINPYPIF